MRTAVIIIFYNAPIDNVHLKIGRSECTELILVDNTPGRDLQIVGERIHYIPLRENRGIATAQNIGIRKGMELGCRHVVFFDQDSIVPQSYVKEIVDEYIRIKQFYPHLAMVGPCLINQTTGKGYKQIQNSIINDCTIVDALISSGSVLDIELIQIVGLMEDALFIDLVDFEWCWRAKSKGLVSVITERVKLYHKVGQDDESFLGYPIIISSPIRYYYQYRNWLWMLKRSYVPFSYKWRTGIRRFVELFVVPMKAKNGMFLFKQMLKGIKDGIVK